MPSHLSLEDYTYILPEDRIAKEPLKNRSDSKLLVYRNGELEDSFFNKIVEYFPDNACLFFNDTRVIPARIHFTKDTGALIEIFILEPILPTTEVASAMLVKNECVWKCMVGNQKKWKEGQHLTLFIEAKSITLKVELIDREEQLVKFLWDTQDEFVQVLEAAGKIPLPPYINREVTYDDKERYQTVYSLNEGAVAAPTAGLHFDDSVFNDFKKKNILRDQLTLHVSAGTFQPVKESNVLNHKMHSEQIIVTVNNINNMLNNDFIIAVGTTSMRTLESIYWYGVNIIDNKTDFFVEKLTPYQRPDALLPSKVEALTAVKDFMLANGYHKLTGQTEIFIFPGYQFKICKGLVTNFHLPGSTLILLVAAFIGESWRDIYKKAIANDYRFLSYGDSSLLIP